MALNQVDYWDKKEKTGALSLEEMEAWKKAREDYKKWVLLEEVLWLQKSREVCLNEEDKNTSYFTLFCFPLRNADQAAISSWSSLIWAK